MSNKAGRDFTAVETFFNHNQTAFDISHLPYVFTCFYCHNAFHQTEISKCLLAVVAVIVVGLNNSPS